MEHVFTNCCGGVVSNCGYNSNIYHYNWYDSYARTNELLKKAIELKDQLQKENSELKKQLNKKTAPPMGTRV